MTNKSIRTERHDCPWGPEWYAIIDDLYDGADPRPIAGVGSTEHEAITDLCDRLYDLKLYEYIPSTYEPDYEHEDKLDHGKSKKGV